MVQRVPSGVEAPPASPVASATTLTERLRAVMALYHRINDLMGDWGDQSKDAPDDAVIAVAHFYKGLCRDLDVRMGEIKRETLEAGLGIDLQPLVRARQHLAIVGALSPENFVKSRRDIKEGRTMTLEQMRRELRNPGV